MTRPLAKGDRVVVADLKRGKVWEGTVTSPARLNPTHVEVADDNGLIWRVGASFVKRAGDNRPFGADRAGQ